MSQKLSEADPHSPVTGYPDFTEPITITGITIDTLPIDIKTQTISTLKIDVATQSLAELKVNIAAQAVTLDVNIAASAVTLNVAIKSSEVTLKVDIAAQTVELNIKTSGGANIVIDRLTQTAVGSRDSWETNYVAKGKGTYGNLEFPRGTVFPRGMRGVIRCIRVWFKNTSGATQTVTFKLLPALGMGAVVTGTRDVADATDSYIYLIDTLNLPTKSFYWNYDQLVVQLEATADLSVQEGDVYPSYIYRDGAYYQAGNLMIAVTVDASSIGDIPVSGTVNTVEIPSTSTTRQRQSLTIGPETEVYDTLQAGAGETLVIFFYIVSAGARDNLHPRVKCDGVQVLPFDWVMAAWGENLVSVGTPGISVGKWDTANNYYSLVIVLPFAFKKSFEVGYYNEEPTTSYTGYVAYTYKKIS